jgi:hypothetical protein
VIQEGVLTCHRADYFSEAFCFGQVAKKHGNELLQATNTTGMHFSIMFLGGLSEIHISKTNLTFDKRNYQILSCR